jgi:hypothetical protein
MLLFVYKRTEVFPVADHENQERRKNGSNSKTTVKVSSKLMRAFKNYVIAKHRKLHGALFNEVNLALEEYLHRHNPELRKYVQQHHFSKPLRKDVSARLERARLTIQNDLATETEISGKELRRVLESATGCRDARPLKNYVFHLLFTGVLDTSAPYSEIGRFDREVYTLPKHPVIEDGAARR